MGIAPVTGIPLPFVSVGGSSMIANLLAIGLLQAIHARGQLGRLRRSEVAGISPARRAPRLVRAGARRRSAPRPIVVARPRSRRSSRVSSPRAATPCARARGGADPARRGGSSCGARRRRRRRTQLSAACARATRAASRSSACRLATRTTACPYVLRDGRRRRAAGRRLPGRRDRRRSRARLRGGTAARARRALPVLRPAVDAMQLVDRAAVQGWPRSGRCRWCPAVQPAAAHARVQARAAPSTSTSARGHRCPRRPPDASAAVGPGRLAALGLGRRARSHRRLPLRWPARRRARGGRAVTRSRSATRRRRRRS